MPAAPPQDASRSHLAALAQTRAAFDAGAPAYDARVERQPVLAWMRARTREALLDRIQPGARVLELGCGTGLDAAFLAGRGYRVTATDWSPVMIQHARERLSRAGLSDQVELHAVGMHELPGAIRQRFSAVYSALGPLNCVADPDEALGAIAEVLDPGGVLVASIMGRVCPWEIAAFGVTGRWRRLAVRFAKGLAPVPFGSGTVWTRYYTPGELSRRLAAAGLVPETTRALGAIVPPPFMDGVARRHPGLVRTLTAVEDRIAGWPGVRALGDHFLVVARAGA